MLDFSSLITNCISAERLEEALAAVHELGVLHGDLRPENFAWWVPSNSAHTSMPTDPAADHESEPARVRLLDFGMASLDPSPEELEARAQRCACCWSRRWKRTTSTVAAR